MIPAALIPPLALVRTHWKAIAGGVALLAFVALFFAYKAEQRHSAKLSDRLAEVIELRAQDRASYVNAQVAAKAKNEAQVAKREAAYQENTNEIRNDYQRDLARVRAGGVRQDLAAPRSATRSAKAGSVPAPSCRDDEANVCVDRKVIVQAAEIELGRNALIDWIERQIAVER